MIGFDSISRAFAAGLAIGVVHAQESTPDRLISPPLELTAHPETVKTDSSHALGYRMGNTEIGPNSTLVFEIELVKIQSAPAPQGLPFPIPQPGAGQ